MPELSIKQWRAVIKKMPREKKEILALIVLKILKKRNDPYKAFEKIEIEIKPLETPEQSYQPQVQYLSGMGKLKQAVIWKEILDKPISLRERDLFRNPFVKF